MYWGEMREAAPRMVVQAALVAVAAGGLAMSIGLSLERGALTAAPALAGLGLAAALLVYTRGLSYARGLAIAVATLAVPLVLEEPYVTERASISISVPPLVVLLLASSRWVVVSAIVTLFLVLARAGFRGEYATPGFLMVYAVYVALVALSRSVLAWASRAAEESAESAELARSRARSSLRALREAQSALRDGETRYRMIAENMADVLALLDLDGRLIWSTPSLARTLGHAPELNLGGFAQSFVHPSDVPEARAAIVRLTRGGQASTALRLRHADGSWRWLECNATMLEREGTKLMLVVARDVTERRSLEEQLRLSQKLECVGRLAGGVAHDFNNLLTIIAGSAHVVRRSLPASSTGERGVSEIEAAVDRAAALTRQLLAFARRQVLERRRVLLDLLVRNTQGLLARLIGEDIRLACRLDADGVYVRVDPTQLEQVLMNLAVNARDAMPGGGTLTISTRRCDVNGGSVVLTIQDTGVGIDPDVLPHVWEPFFSTKGPQQGTGLGLATCYGIVEQHGGTIEMDSLPGRGTTVRVCLPIAEQQDETAPPPSSRRAPAPTRGASILVVEDDAAVRSLTAELLRDSGYRVEEASDGEQALALLRSRPRAAIDVLVTDLVMPQMGGRQLVEHVRQLRPAIAVLMVSGYASREAPTSGVDGVLFLQKPYSAQGLVRAVEAALQHCGGASTDEVISAASTTPARSCPAGLQVSSG